MLPGDDRFAVTQDDPGGICLLFLIAEALQADLGQQAGAVRLHIRRRYEHVLEVNGRHDEQGDFSVDAAIGQIVDAAAKGGVSGRSVESTATVTSFSPSKRTRSVISTLNAV